MGKDPPHNEPITDEQRATFLATLAVCGNVTKACDEAGFSRMTAYRHRADDPEFAATWEEAKKIGGEGIIDEIRRRGHDGWDEPTLYQGEHVDTVRKYSDTLLIFLAKVIFPELRDSRLAIEHSGKMGLKHELDLSLLEPDELRAIKSLIEKAQKSTDESAS